MFWMIILLCVVMKKSRCYLVAGKCWTPPPTPSFSLVEGEATFCTLEGPHRSKHTGELDKASLYSQSCPQALEWLQACPCCLLHCQASMYSAWMSGFLPSFLPGCLLIHQSPLICLSLSGQLFVQSVYYLYSMCIFVVQLFSVFLSDSLPPSHVCLHVDARCLCLFEYLHFAGRLRCSLPAACCMPGGLSASVPLCLPSASGER